MVQVRADGPLALDQAGPPLAASAASQERSHHGRPADVSCPSARSRRAVAAAGRPLDLHEGIVPPGQFEDCRKGCPRWPAGLLLRWTRGDISGWVEGRCGATNLCRYCQRLYVVETVEMLTLDAMEHAPGLWMVLTAREHLTRSDLRRHLEHVRRVTRRRWPDVEWFVQVEFQRRGALHANLLIKGVPIEHQEQLHEAIASVWCARVDAEPVGQWSGVVADGVGVVRYISKMLAHGLKAEQAPPIGWRGHRTSQTRGYLVRPASVMRQEARASLQIKRELFKVAEAAPELDAATVNDIAQELVDRHRARSWDIVAVDPVAAERLLAGQSNPPCADTAQRAAASA
jgi:hypothetical protein